MFIFEVLICLCESHEGFLAAMLSTGIGLEILMSRAQVVRPPEMAREYFAASFDPAGGSDFEVIGCVMP